MARYGMVIDAAHCVGCQTCVVACQMEHGLRPQMAWLHVDAIEQGRWPNAERLYLPHGCLSCDEPACVRVCPTGASFIDKDHTPLINHEACIGCGVCVVACPYGARAINRSDRWFFDAAEPAPYEGGGAPVGTVEKCTLCIERRKAQEPPACVEACPVEARAFGDLDDPDDPIWDFIEKSGAERSEGTATYYACPNQTQQPNIASEIVAHGMARQNAAPNEPSGQSNPSVLVTATVCGAAAAGAIALGTVHARNKAGANDRGLPGKGNRHV